MERKYKRLRVEVLRGKSPVDKINKVNFITNLKKEECNSQNKTTNKTNNPSQLKIEINSETFNLILLTKEIEKLKEKRNQLQISINNYKNSIYVATKFLSELENNLEKVINEITLKEKERECLKQNL